MGGCTTTATFAMLAGILKAQAGLGLDTFSGDAAAMAKNASLFGDWFNSTLAKDPLRSGNFIQTAPRNDAAGPPNVLTRDTRVPWYDWIPGDWGWIKNVAGKDEKHRSSAYAGKNIIYVGGGFFSGGYRSAIKNYTLSTALKEVWWEWTDKNVTGRTFVYVNMRRDPDNGGLLRDVRDYPTLYQYW